MIELIGYLAAGLTTISFLPQAIQVIKTKDTKSISLYMYAFFTLGVFSWSMYGILTNNMPLIFANIITTILASIILWYKINENKRKNG